jgi:hypothetical protein
MKTQQHEFKIFKNSEVNLNISILICLVRVTLQETYFFKKRVVLTENNA